MADGPRLAEGLADYIAAVRGAPAKSLETARLVADLSADRIAYPRPAGMKVASSFIAGARGETGVRIYRPLGEGPQGAICYYHGGGFTTGSVETYEPVAMALAEASGATVVSVHYARLPEVTPRAMLEECYAALCWTAEMAPVLGVEAERVAVAGDSAGAMIATLLAMLARDREGPRLACQILAYGAYDLDETRASYREARDPILTLPVIKAMVAMYRACDAGDPAPLPPPLHCADLSGLPPALIVSAEHDPMLEEGNDYAERLRQAGVAVQLRVAPDMPHGFLRAVRFSVPARDEMRRLGEAARAQLQPARTSP